MIIKKKTILVEKEVDICPKCEEPLRLDGYTSRIILNRKNCDNFMSVYICSKCAKFLSKKIEDWINDGKRVD